MVPVAEFDTVVPCHDSNIKSLKAKKTAFLTSVSAPYNHTDRTTMLPSNNLRDFFLSAIESSA